MKKVVAFDLDGTLAESKSPLPDRMAEGGNDYPVKAMGIDSLEISHWRDTALAVEAINHVA